MPNLPPVAPPVNDTDKTLAVLCHISILLGVGFVLPLVVYLVKRNDSPYVAENAKEVLNFHLSILIYCVAAFPLCFILVGFLIYVALGIMAFVCAIIAALKTGEGVFYRYPLTLRMIS